MRLKTRSSTGPSRVGSHTVAEVICRCIRLAGVTSASSILLGSVVGKAQEAPGSPALSDDSGASNGGLAEITVTAQRRKQSVQDIPYNISAVNASAISNAGAASINDLTRVVPGLTTVDEGLSARGNTNNLTLRGLRTDAPGGGKSTAEEPGGTVSSVSTYFGETPVFFPMPLYDVDRIEVLRGPQGTLYGSGAQAGTIRFVPKRPDFNSASGSLELDGSKSEHSNDPSRKLIGIGNVPFSDTLALRVVAGRDHEGGFIDNNSLVVRQGKGLLSPPSPSIAGDYTSGPIIGPLQRDTNYADEWFARGALRWKPQESIDLQLDYLRQHIYSNNSSYSNPGYPGGTLDMTTPTIGPISPTNPAAYPNSSFVSPPGGTYVSTAFLLSPYEDTIDLVSGVGTFDLGPATLTSATSFYNNRSTGVSDYTGDFDLVNGVNFNLYPPYNFYPRLFSPQPAETDDRSFIQELRLVSNGKNRFDYVAGLYYQREIGRADSHQYLPGIQQYLSYIGQPNPSTMGDLTFHNLRNTEFQDRAAFGELTLHATSQWQVTVGARAFRQTFSANGLGQFWLCGAPCSTSGTDPGGSYTTSAGQSASRVIKKINTSYDLTSDIKVYVTYSEGFRRGGANSIPLSGNFASLPGLLTFTPDIAKNYEVGLKGQAFEHRLRYSFDVYRINLNDFQFDTSNLSAFTATYNGKTARSQGVELELEAALTADTSMSMGYAYTDAKVTSTFQIYDLQPYALNTALGGVGQTGPIFAGPITAGTRLPGVSKNTLSAAIDHTVSLGKDFGTLTLHADGAYRSASTGDISAASEYFWVIPSSFMGNLRATLEKGPFSYQAYVQNVTGNVGYSGGTFVQTIPNYSRFRNVARPRTYGLTLRWNF
jgi:iron complex outermembrane recepter protein